MPRSRQSRISSRRLLFRAAIVAIIALPIIAWLLPRRVHDVVSIDGRHRWEHAEAPPQKRIVWQPAERLPAKVAPEAAPEIAKASLVRPQWADGGMTLYFTLQREDGSADIYRSRFDGSGWTAGVAVKELNSDADDFGPVISADGSELYLYSDRTGGYGGFDLYVARRTAEGWSPPVNLGQSVNSPAHEYDPAVSPDGQRLLFSSNRTPAMQERLAAASDDEGDANLWKATLRAEPGLRQFDIYAARRAEPSHAWSDTQSVRAVNTSVTNEGEPYFSPNGAFLYFASDRANEHGADANYDIYRARIAGERIFDIENLGPGVNTAANEHDPALSAEGFRIVFSSDRMEAADNAAATDVYALYVSQASEIYDEAGWDSSHLALITENLWFIVLLLLLAALLAALVWYLRQVSLRRAPVPAFFLIALLLHLLLATGAFFVPLDGMTLVQRIKNEMDKVVATNVQLDSTERPRENAYEKVADVDAASAANVSPAPREQSQPDQVALATEFNSPKTPSLLAGSRPAAPVMVQPAPQPIQAENPLLQRQRRPLEEAFAANPIKLEQTQAQEADAPTQSPQAAIVELAKTKSDSVKQLASRSTPRVESTRPLESEAIDSQPAASVAQPQAADTATLAISRQTRRMVEQFEPSKVALEQSSANSPTEREMAQAQAANVEAARQADATNVTPHAAAFQTPTNSSRATPLTVAAVDATEPSPAVTPSRTNSPTESSLPRQDRLAKVDFSAADRIPIDNDSPARPALEQGLAATSPQVKVELDRNATGAPDVNFETPQPATSSGSQASTVTPAASAAAEAASRPSHAALGLDAVAELFNRKPNRPIEFAQSTAKLSGDTSLPGDDSSVSEPAALRGSDVEVGRTSDSASSFGDVAAEITTNANSPAPTQLATAAGAVRQELSGPQGVNRDTDTAFQFNRARRAAPEGGAAAQAALETLQSETQGDSAGELTGAPGAEVSVDRAASGDVVSVESLLGGIGRTSLAEQGVPGIEQLARLDLDARFDGFSSNSPLDRRTARPAFMSYAQGKIGLQSMLRLRVSDDATKRDLIEAFGGSPDTLPAIARGLTWLAQVQHEEGNWQLHNFPKSPSGQNYSGHGNSKSDTAATGLALLPFLGDGHTHLGGKYQKTVERGMRWLLEHQDDDGNLFTGGEGNAHMYSHGIAAIALCEAYGMTKDDQLREPAQRAIDYIVRAQHSEGGWRYKPGDQGDMSVVGWQVMALKSAQIAGLNVPDATLDKARAYLEASRRGNDKAEFGYQKNGGGSPAMTAEGLLCYQYLGAKAGDPKLMRTVEVVAARPPKHRQDTSYYWYYGTQAMFHIQGDPWKQWNEGMQEALLFHQVKDGPNVGTWDPHDNWEQSGGRIMSTSLRLLMLEVSFRHLPLYQALD